MKKYILSVLLVGMASPVWAVHQLIFRDASALTTGTVSNILLDPSSVTMRGGQWSSDIDIATSALRSAVAVDSTTLKSMITDLSAATQTVSARFDAVNTSATVVTQATATLQVRLNAVATDTATITSSLATSTTALASRIQFVTKAYDVVIGTIGTPGVDVEVSNLATFNIALASIGACGLVYSATGYGRILMREGVYNIQGATIPRGVELIGMSTTVWMGSVATQGLVKIYGKADAIKFDCNNLAFSSHMVWVSSGGRLLNSEIYNASSQVSGSVRFASALFVDGADNVVQGNTIRDIRATDGVSYYGDVAPIILMSTGLMFADNTITYTNPAGVNSTSFSIWGTTTASIIRNRIYNLSQNGISFNNGVKTTQLRDNFITVTNSAGAPDNGVIMAKDTGNRGAVISSGVVIADNIIMYNAAASATIFNFPPLVANAQVLSLVVSGNVVDGQSGSGFTFANIGTGGLLTIFTNNHTLSHGAATTFIIDAGGGTKYTTQLNFKDGIQQ